MKNIIQNNKNDLNEEHTQEKDLTETEKAIRNALLDPISYCYSQFLESTLDHSAKYVLIFEKKTLM